MDINPASSVITLDDILRLLGESDASMKYICVSGSEGKSSRAAALASVLRSTGLKTGLFLPKYLRHEREGYMVDGEQISEDLLSSMKAAVDTACRKAQLAPSAELLSAACAYLWFSRENCGAAVLVCPPASRNAFPSAAAFFDKSEPESPELSVQFDSPEGQVFAYRGETYATPMLGRHQLLNAAAVIDSVSFLQHSLGWKIPNEALEHGLYAVSLPARFELVSETPDFIVDCGRTPAAAEAVAECLSRYYPDRKHVLLLAGVSGELLEAISSRLASAADEFVLAGDFTAGDELQGVPLTVCTDIADAVRASLDIADELDGVVCSFGPADSAKEIRLCFNLA